MRTVPLGATGVEVSALCLGAMYFGSKNDKATSYRMLDMYTGAGGAFIDTANIYAHWISGSQGGESETLLGEWVRERGNRDELFIATKVGFGYPGVQQGLSAAQIEAECNKSLGRLGIDTIDLYYAHVDDYETPLEETLAAFDRLIQAGKVRYIGASNYLAWRLEQAKWSSVINEWSQYCCVQQRHTYLRPKPGTSFSPQKAVNNDLLEFCKLRNMPIVAYSVLLSGAYTRPDRRLPDQYVGPDSKARLSVLKEVAEEVNSTVNQVVLAWMLHHDTLTIPLIAASSEEQMQENLSALEFSLSDEQMTRLNGAGV